MEKPSNSLGSRLNELIEKSGRSRRALAESSGVPESTIRNIITGVTDHPRGDTLIKLAQALSVSEQYLLTGHDQAAAEADSISATPGYPSEVRFAPEVKVPIAFNLPKDLPTLGTAAGSELGQGAFQLSTDVIEYVRRPPGLFGVKDAYALYVEGDSMYPRFEPGDLIFCHPHKKPRGGDYIVVQEPDSNNGENRAFIKRLVKITSTTLVVEQFNPPATIQFIIRPGLVWHKVLTDGDLYSF